jgi:hypothetical protein
MKSDTIITIIFLIAGLIVGWNWKWIIHLIGL